MPPPPPEAGLGRGSLGLGLDFKYLNWGYSRVGLEGLGLRTIGLGGLRVCLREPRTRTRTLEEA